MRSSSIVPQKARAGSKAPPRHVQPGSRPCGRGAAATVAFGAETANLNTGTLSLTEAAEGPEQGKHIGGGTMFGAAASRKQGTS